MENKTSVLGVKLERLKPSQYVGNVHGVRVLFYTVDKKRGWTERWGVELYGMVFFYKTKSEMINALISKEENDGVIEFFSPKFKL